MQKTDNDKKIIIVIDEYGNVHESTYPKRARGLVKSGRARYVNENTILLITDLPKNYNLEENKMTDNQRTIVENNNLKEQSSEINQEYIIKKIDEIIKMNQEALLRTDLAQFSNVPGTKNPIQSICETNNKMIDLLREMYVSNLNKKSTDDFILEGYMRALEESIGNVNSDDDTRELLINAINGYKMLSK